eukprot:CAMPEP_0119270164 /NCGR_PEP_ID=MMETSP1329-20130426/7279_1 /TAXON_ID=114041 /ORGANISM="Genus nov. species nov., Strain RCC1024" /LENGTH=86 /DNA_ID=CAMNT_0007270173 /DNA_START=170 /DNA_END=427 /DNA_ORIENTATION=-
MGAGGSVPKPAQGPQSLTTPAKKKPTRAAAVDQSVRTIGRIVREGIMVQSVTCPAGKMSQGYLWGDRDGLRSAARQASAAPRRASR